jgi:hypothetical protein
MTIDSKDINILIIFNIPSDRDAIRNAYNAHTKLFSLSFATNLEEDGCCNAWF